MQEDNWCAMRANARLIQNTHPLLRHSEARSVDVFDLKADMMLSAFWVFFQEFRDGGFIAIGLNKFHLPARQIDEERPHRRDLRGRGMFHMS